MGVRAKKGGKVVDSKMNSGRFCMLAQIQDPTASLIFWVFHVGEPYGKASFPGSHSNSQPVLSSLSLLSCAGFTGGTDVTGQYSKFQRRDTQFHGDFDHGKITCRSDLSTEGMEAEQKRGKKNKIFW